MSRHHSIPCAAAVPGRRREPLRSSTLPATALVSLAAAAALICGPARAQTIPASVNVIEGLGGVTGSARVVGNSDAIANFSDTRANYAAGYAISGDGSTVVGASNTSSGVARAFLWRDTAGVRDLGSLVSSTNASFAASVSRDGGVVVGHSEVTPGRWQAFRWTLSGGMENLGTFAPGNAGYSTALDVSDDGEVVVGGAYTASTVDRAFRWTRTTGMVNLGVLAGGSFSDALGVSGDGNVVVGLSEIGGGQWRAFRWTQSTGMVDMGTIGGFAGRSAATSANTDGSVIVGMSVVNAAGQTHAFRWTAAAGMVDLGTIGGAAGNSIAHGVSGDGSIVVGSSQFSANSPNRAFVWTQGAGMQDLGAILAAGGVNMTGIELVSARGVSQAGDLVTGAGVFSSAAGGTRPYVARLPAAGGPGVPGLTTAEAVAQSIDRLARSRTAQMVTQVLLASVHLGVNDQISCAPQCGGAYLSFGSFNASVHGRQAIDSAWSLVGGAGLGRNDDPGVDVTRTVSLAGALRFDPADRGPSRPFFEWGVALAPNQETTYTRTYANGAGNAEGTGRTRTHFAQSYLRAGWVQRADRRTELAASASIGRTWLRSRAYSETEGDNNPFEARVAAGTDVTTLASLGVQATRLVHPRLELSVHLHGHRSLEARSDLKATVRGFGEVAPQARRVSWLQPGMRAGVRLSRQLVLDLFANASVGPDGGSTQAHGGFGLTGRF